MRLDEARPDARNVDTRAYGLWLLGITAAGLILRLMAIDAHSFWYDEAESVRFIQFSFTDLALGHRHDNGSPPFYFLVLKPWATAFGTSELALHALSALFGVLTIPLAARLGRRLLGPRPSLLAAGLLAISPYAIELSNEARTYALVGLLAVVATLLFVRWIDGPNWGVLAVYAVVIFLVCYSHYYGFAVPVSHGLSLLLTSHRRRLIAWAGAMAGSAILWSFWLPAFMAQLGHREAAEGTRSLFVGAGVALGLGRTLAWGGSPAVWLLSAVAIAALCFWLPSALGLLRERRRDPFAAVLLGAWALLPIGVPLALALLKPPQFAVRYAAVGLPALLLLVAAGYLHLRPAVRRPLALLLVAATALSLFRYATRPLKDDWRSAAALAFAGPDLTTPLLVDRDHEAEPLRYYALRRGVFPPNLIQVKTPPGAAGRLRGARLGRDGFRVEAEPYDLTDEILSAGSVWLFLCRPAGVREDYVRMFAQRGFRAEAHALHRIEAIHFTREPARPATPPGSSAGASP